MSASPRILSFVRRAGITGLALASAISVLSPLDAAAQHRARVGGSLAKHLSEDSGSVHFVLEAPQAEVDRLARAYGVLVQRRLGMGAVLVGNSSQVERLAADASVAALAADDVVVSTMAISSQSTGASLLWEGEDRGLRFGGLTGTGVGVAVLDSGISEHDDVARRVRLRLDFTGEEGVGDVYGHGTHVAGIIAGSGAGSRNEAGTQYVGMAPGAELLSLRVLGADGTGNVSDVIAAIEWVIANKDQQKIRVINLSLGHATTNDYRDDPLGRAVERAVAAGLVVVASAGNLGKTEDGTPVVGMVVSPGFTPGALTVGALNTKGTVMRSDDGVATYSSRGPVGDPDDPSTWIIKPDLVAPGNAIVSAGAQGSYLWDNYPSRRVIGETGGTYLVLSGSSMATAVTSGAVAQLLQLEPKLTPAEVKFAIQFTAERLNDFGIIEQGAGSLNVPLAAALVASRHVFSAPTSVEIAGEIVEASEITFASSIVWGSRGGGLGGNSIVWGSRGGGLGGNSIVWGSRGGGLGGNSIVWGSRGGGLGGNSIVWGSRGGGLSGDSIVWGSRGGGLGGNSIVWGSRGGGLGGNSIVWGSRGGGLGGDSIVWGSRGGGLGGDSIVWGSRGGGLSGDSIVWGSRGGGLGGNSIVWGSRGGDTGSSMVWGSSIVWGSRGGGLGGDSIVWGSRGGGLGGDSIVWGSRGGGLWSDSIVWGSRGGGLGGDSIVWGSRGGGLVGDSIVWGSRR
jgi:serine protease AprX